MYSRNPCQRNSQLNNMKEVHAQTADGLQLGGRLFETPNREHIILHIPGMAGDIYNLGYYREMSDRFPTEGVSFLASETRSYKNKITKGTEYTSELFEDSLLDIDAWFGFTNSLGYKNIWMQASSLGSAKIVNWYYNRKPIDLAGFIFLSPSDMIGLVHDKEGIIDHNIMLSKAKALVAEGRGKEEIDHLLWGIKTLTANAYISLFGDNSEAAIFNYGDQTLGWKKVNSINKPVLSFTCTNDDGIYPVMDVHRAMDILEKQLADCPRKRIVIYDGGDHDFNGLEDKLVSDTLEFVFDESRDSKIAS